MSASSRRHRSVIRAPRAVGRALVLALSLAAPAAALAQPPVYRYQDPAAAPMATEPAVETPAPGTTLQALGVSIAPEEIEARISSAEAAQDLPEAQRVVELYRFALSRLETAAGFERSAAELAALIESGPAKTQAFRKELQAVQGSKPDTSFLREPQSAAQLEQRLIREQTALTARRSRLDDLEKLATGLQTRPAEARAQLAEARGRLAELESASKTAPPTSEPAAVTEARQISLAARAVARRAEIAALEQELLSFDIRSQLVAVERELAVASLSLSEERVKLFETALGERRALDAEIVQRQTQQRQRDAIGSHPVVRDLAQRNASLGQEVTRQVESREWVAKRRARIDERLKDLESSERTARKGVEIAGVNPALGQILRNQRVALAGIDELLSGGARRESLTSEAGLRLFEVTEDLEDRADRREVLGNIMGQVEAEISGGERRAIESELEQYLAEETGLLDKLRAGYSGMLSDLVELDFERRQLDANAARFEGFLEQHLIWTPSAPAMGRVAIEVQRRAVATFFAPGNWLATVRAAGTRLAEEWVNTTLVLLAAAALIAARRRLRRALDACNARVNRMRQETFKNTPMALGLCALWVLPVPLVLFYIALLLRGAGEIDPFARAAGEGLRFGVLLLFLAHGLRVMCKPGGVAERHFRWPRQALDKLRAYLRVKLYAVPLLVAGIVMTLEYPEPDMAQTVGRFFFIGFELCFVWFFARALHPSKGLLSAYFAAYPNGWQTRLRHVWWLALMLMPLALIVTAAVGYGYTAAVLGELLLLTVWMIVGVVVLQAVVVRWLAIAQRRMVYQQMVDRREAARSVEGSSEEASDAALLAPEEPEVDLAAIHTQARHLLNSVVGVSLVVGLILIWAPVVPAFGMFEAVQLWSTTATVDGKEVIEAVTLGDVLLALIAAVVVAVLARDLPGFLEFAVLQRLPLAAGSRYAISSLAQYGFVTVGVLFVVGRLGLRWSEVQWLVAALGVGLGFGLQEIVANFVSGIILLFERPIRIGDVVTVGNLTGTVSRIRIRATTITDFDNKEIVVPNKTFITGDLTNWSLTDSVTRVVVPVGIAYGSDTDRAHEIMDRVARANPMVLETPEPQVFFLGFGDSSLNFEVRVWVRELSNRLPTTDFIHSELARELAAAGIEIPFPQRDVNVRVVEGQLGLGNEPAREPAREQPWPSAVPPRLSGSQGEP